MKNTRIVVLLAGLLSAPISAFASTAPASHGSEALPFIHDDYPRALAEARARKVPLFIDTAAPWCHTCKSMDAYVFTDHALSDQTQRFVWLSLDTEKARNAAVVKRLKLVAIPTYFIENPADESISLRWVGAATVPQLKKILDDGIAAVANGSHVEGGDRPPGSPAETPEQALAQADKLYGAGDNAGSVKAYREALARAPEGWPQYSRAVESLLFALSVSDDNEGTARLALDAYPKLSKTSSAANLAATGLESAVSMPESLATRKDYIAKLSIAARAVLDDPSIVVAADDRAAVYSSLYDARKDAKDSAGAAEIGRQWTAYLEDQAAHADTPEKRTALDPDRVGAYLELGTPERGIAMLEQSEKDFPDDYNPPARLANLYRAMKDWDKALAASDRAMAHAYGPRKLGLYRTRADIFVGKGDTASARKTLAEAIQMAQNLPDGQRSEGAIASLRKKLTDMGGGS